MAVPAVAAGGVVDVSGVLNVSGAGVSVVGLVKSSASRASATPAKSGKQIPAALATGPNRNAVIRQAQSSQLQGTLFPSISFMIFSTSLSSASLRRRSQSTPYQITGYCMSTQATSTTSQTLGWVPTSCPMVLQFAALSIAQKIIQPSNK